MAREIEVDYLIVGAGAAGMAIADELLTHSDATIAIADRRHAPGGHWIDAYPFVRLHQPSTFYGVSSTPLGGDRTDETGHNQGYYELAGASEICAYYDRVMHRRFITSGRVTYLPNSDANLDAGPGGEHRVVSRLTGAETAVRVNRKLVDARYVEGSIPATSPPPFEIADGVRWVPAGGLARLDAAAGRYVIIGAGKTALDACVWLLERGVSPASIRWIKPREAWWLNRRFHQPHDLSPDYYTGVALQLEAIAASESIDAVFERLEADHIMLRIDPGIEPTMFRGALISEREQALLAQIEDVVRIGRVARIERDQIIGETGSVATDPDAVHVHCAARGLAIRPLRPIFEPRRITVQMFGWGFACYQFATLGVIEATLDSDDEKNRLVSPIDFWDTNPDYISAFMTIIGYERARRAHPTLSRWADTTRLSPTSGAAAHRDDPRLVDARRRIKASGARAAENAGRLLAD